MRTAWMKTGWFRRMGQPVVVLALACALPVMSSPADQSIEQRMQALLEADQAYRHLPGREHRARIAHAYDGLFGSADPSRLGTASTAELRTRFRAADMAAFYSFRLKDVQTMRTVLDELVRRDEVTAKELGDMHRAYVGLRRFDEARSLASAHHLVDVEGIPAVVDAAPASRRATTALCVSPTSDALTRRRLDLDTYTGVVVISHPLCHFSRNAVSAIEQDPVLETLFRAHSIWIAPVDRRLHLDTLRQWNRQHPIAPHAIAYVRDEWPPATSWSTPSFHFLKNGRVVGKVTGWPQEGRRQALIDEARRIGFDELSLPDAAATPD